MEASRVLATTVLVICILSCCSLTMAEEFAYFKLAIQWPVAYCNRGIPCNRPVKEEFKIHGLWPFWANNSIVTSPCLGDDMPAIREVRNWDIKRSLDNNWPSLDGDNYLFWQHEWDTHGRCSGLEPYGFFKLAITLAKNHLDLQEKLLGIGYAPTTHKWYNSECYIP